MKNVKIFISTLATLAVFALLLVPLAAAAPGEPCTMYGYVTVDGVGTNGISVSCPGGNPGSYVTKTDGGGHSGYFQFDVTNGSHYTLSASYGGGTASQGVDANGRLVRVDLSITTSTPSPSPSPSPSPTACPSSNGGTVTYENGAIGGNATVTPSPSVTATPTSEPSVTATPTTTATPTPTVAPSSQPSETSFPWWLLLILIAIVVVAAGAYLVLRRK